MRNPPRLWPRLVQVLLILAVPVVLFVADLRIVTGHWFVRWEYGKAGFPPDPFGLPAAERMRLAEVCVDYLATNADISLLEDLRLPDGAPAFNARELSHMADVQLVYNQLMVAGVIATVVAVGGFAILLTARHARRQAAAALMTASTLTLGLLGAVGASMVLNWDAFFTTFHRMFFEGDTWLFPYSDTLIRLFPIRFWTDIATVLVGLLVVELVILGATGWVWLRQVRQADRP